MMGDCHIYENHQTLIHKYLDSELFECPVYTLKEQSAIDQFVPEDLVLIDYQHGDKIDFPFNV
jgi:thymidylate synthase